MFKKPLSGKTPILPTLRQFCKQADETACLGTYLVKIIWFPNKFPTLTVQTTHFRIPVSDKDLIEEMMGELRKVSTGKSAIEVRLIDLNELEYEFQLNAQNKGVWEERQGNLFFL